MEKFTSQPTGRSPLDLGIEMTDTERTAIVDAVEQRAIEKSEDHLPSSQPSYDTDDWIIQANREAIFNIDDYTGQFYD